MSRVRVSSPAPPIFPFPRRSSHLNGTVLDPIKTQRLNPRWHKQVTDYVTDLAWSPDGRHLAAATGAGTLELFTADGTPGPKHYAHALGIECLTWIREGLFSGAQDQRLCLWDPTTLTLRAEHKKPRYWFHCLDWSGHPVDCPGGGQQPLLAAACGKSVLFCDAQGTLLNEIHHPTHTIEDLCWFPNGSILLTASYGGLQTWDPANGNLLRTYEWPAALWSCSCSPDGRWLSAGSQENAVHIWNAQNGDHMHMPGYEGKVRHQAWSADSRWLATAGGMDVILWDCSGPGPEGRQGKLCAAHADSVSGLAFHPHSPHLASACAAGRVLIWNADGEDEILGAAVINEPLTSLAWSPTEDRLAVGTAQGNLIVF